MAGRVQIIERLHAQAIFRADFERELFSGFNRQAAAMIVAQLLSEEKDGPQFPILAEFQRVVPADANSVRTTVDRRHDAIETDRGIPAAGLLAFDELIQHLGAERLHLDSVAAL